MRRPIVAGNWKMHGSRAENDRLLEAVLARLPADGIDCECVVCPPFVYLHDLARTLRDSVVALGAQDVCAEPQGAFTGEVSAAMLRDVGCSFVIVGHSERRALFAESDQLVARKFSAALARGLVPILCVGEQAADRDADRSNDVVARQLDAVLELSGAAALASAVIAYEPVWAIGTGRNATPQQAQDMHAFIRGRISARDATIAGSVRILYGGSVKASNARELFAMPDVDGGLIGGASLKAEEFVAIVAATKA
jgi:triosephosphate isomerase (TIM)